MGTHSLPLLPLVLLAPLARLLPLDLLPENWVWLEVQVLHQHWHKPVPLD
jgi:hypothetical protein